MNESKILRAACDDKWYAQAYAEYLADVAETTSNLIGACQEVLGFDSDDEIPIDDAQITAILEKYGINPQARMCLPDIGALSAINICKYLANKTDDPDYQLGESGFEASVDEVCTTIRGTWTQSVIASKAFASYCDDAKSAIDRGTKFIQDVQSEFAVDDTVRGVYSTYQSMISSNPSVDQFLSAFLKASGVDTVADDDEATELDYYNCELYNYTGNTPALALDFSTVNKAVDTTVKVAAKVVKGVFSAISKGATWLFNKAKKYVVDTVIDPAVAEFVGDEANNAGFLDGFAWFGQFTPNVSHSHFNTGAQISDLFAGFSDEYAEKWVKIRLKTGELIFKIVNDTTDWQAYFKPVAIDVQFLKDNILTSLRAPGVSSSDILGSIDTYHEWLTSIAPYIQPLDKSADKVDLAMGFHCATVLTQSIAHAAFLETFILVKGSTAVSTGPISSFGQGFDLSDYNKEDYIDSVTNINLITCAAGDPSSSTNLNNYLGTPHLFSIYDTTAQFSMRSTITDLISAWALCRVERRDNPIDYTFVPYSNNHSGFTPSSWRVKSDSAIAETRDNFIQAALIAAVVVVAVVVIGVTVKKITTKMFFKRQETIGTLENKMWNGGRLTPKERRKYIRANRKQAASRLLSTGNTETSYSSSNDLQSIIARIG